VKQGKYQGTHRSGPGPSVGCEQLVQREPAGHGHQAVPLHVYHDQKGQDQLAGRKTQDKCGKDDAVHSQKPGGRVQNAGKKGEKTGPVYPLGCKGQRKPVRPCVDHIGQEPDKDSGRNRSLDGAGHHDQGPVQQGAQSGGRDPRLPVRRHFQDKSRGKSL